MPVAGMLADKCVNDPLSSQSTGDDRIRVNVGIIVEVDEVVPHSLAENEPRSGDEQDADNRDRLSLRSKRSLARRNAMILPFTPPF